MPAKKAAKKAATKAASEVPSPKKAAKKAAKKAPKAAPAAGAPAPPKPAKAPKENDIPKAAYLNYRSRVEQGLYGDQLGDWLAAERTDKGSVVPP